MNRPVGIAIATFALCVCRTTPALAQPSAQGASQEASRHFARGIKLFEDDDWRTALIEFERAYAIEPNYRVLYDIGQCRYQLHDYPGALAAFQRYLAEGADHVTGDRRAQVESDIDVLKGRVARVRVSSASAGVEVRIDDVVIGTTPFAAPVVVSAGRRKVAGSKAGLSVVTRYVDLAGDETADVVLDPEPSSSSPPASAAASPEANVPTGSLPNSRGAKPSLAPAWIAFAACAAGVGVGTFFGLTAMNDKKELDRECVAKSCPLSSQPLISASQRDALLSTIGAGVGLAGALTGAAYLLLTSGDRPRPNRPSIGVFVDSRTIGAAGTF